MLDFLSKQTKTKKNPTAALSKAYIAAFIAIALISIFAHLITSTITNIQKESFGVSYLINQERTLVEQIATSSNKFNNFGKQLDHDITKHSLESLKINHQNFLHSIKKEQLFSSQSTVLKKLFFEEPFALDKNITEFIQNVEVFLSYDANSNSLERKNSYDFIQLKSRSLLQPLLSKAFTDYQNEVITKVNFYHFIQLLGLVLILAVLLLEAYFIFNPLINKIKNYHAALLKQAYEDPLTKLNNRRAFMQRAEAALKHSNRHKRSAIIAITDLDHFKSVNDTYGHDIGDEVLKHFAKIINKSLRAGDIIGRIGGEEFALFMPDSSYENAKGALERFCKDIEANPCPYLNETNEQKYLKYTVSLGYTQFTPDINTTLGALMKKADEALYEAKKNGRNQAVYKVFEPASE